MTFNTMDYLGYVNKDESIITPQPRAPFAPSQKQNHATAPSFPIPSRPLARL